MKKYKIMRYKNGIGKEFYCIKERKKLFFWEYLKFAKNIHLTPYGELTEEAYKAHTEILNLKSTQLGLYAERTKLFAESLEEQTFLEKVKFFAPSCIKKIIDND